MRDIPKTEPHGNCWALQLKQDLGGNSIGSLDLSLSTEQMPSITKERQLLQ